MKIFMSLVILVAVVCFGRVWADTNKSSLTWLTNYEEAVNQARTQNKPLLLFFTGTGWCGACARLEKEALNTPEFAQIVAYNQFIFVKVDFPRNQSVPQDSKTSAQNQQSYE